MGSDDIKQAKKQCGKQKYVNIWDVHILNQKTDKPLQVIRGQSKRYFMNYERILNFNTDILRF